MEVFVVRLWETADARSALPRELRGVVQHVGSGRSSAFVSAEELLALLSGEKDADREPERV